jgi:ATP-dependent DNA ligase
MLSSAVDEGALDRYEADDNYTFEQKADGHRRLTYVVDGEVIPLNRSGTRTTLPITMLKVLGSQHLDFAVDGELIGTGRNRRLWLFDMPWVDGLIDSTTPFHQRRAALETLHAQLLLAGGGVEVLPQAATTAAKRWLCQSLKAASAEGIVIKHRDHIYLPGARQRRSPQSMKVKWRKTVDCVVTGLGIDGRDNIGLGVYDRDGTLIDVGEVTAQAGDGPRIKTAFNQADEPFSIVVEVTCLHTTANNRLFQPTMPRLRADKPASHCTVDQVELIRAEKSVFIPTTGRKLYA